MLVCEHSPGFYIYFKRNMDALNLPVPGGYFDTAAKAGAAIKMLAAYAEKYDTFMTVGQIVKDGPLRMRLSPMLIELALIAGSVTIAAYAGACIGSFIIATEYYMRCHVIPQHQLRNAYQRLVGSKKVLPPWVLAASNNTRRVAV